MNFNNNLPGTPRMMRPKAVSVSPIHSPIGNVIARPVVTLMAPQRQSQYVLGTSAVPQVYQGARLSQTLSSSQPRISAQVMYPQQNRVPVQLAGRVAQNRAPGVPSYPTVAFQSRIAYPVQRPATRQVHPSTQVLISGRVNSGSNVPMFKPAVSNIATPFQTQHRYALPTQVSLGKQFIMTQNRGLIPSHATANVLPAGVMQRLTNMNSAQIISQNELPMRVNPNICISVAASNTMSYTVNRTSSTVSQSGSTTANISSVTSNDESISLLSPSSGPPQMTSHPATTTILPVENFLTDDVSMPSLSTELPNFENMEDGLSCELPVNNPDVDKDSDMNSMPNETVMLVSEDVGVNLDITHGHDMGSIVLLPGIEKEAVVLCEDNETLNISGNVAKNPSESVFPVDFIPKQMADTVSEHIVIDPLIGEQSITVIEGDNTEGLNTNTVDEINDAAISLNVAPNPLISEGTYEPCNEAGTENAVVNFTDSANDNSMDTDNHVNESQDREVCVNEIEINQSEIDDNSQESGPGFSEKALSTCQYCSDEDSQLTGVSSDLYTEDSSNMSWEKFHEKVLNLRVNKDRVKTSISSLEESKLSSCDSELASKSPDKTVVDDKTHEVETSCNDGDDSEEPDFVWEDYLQQTGASAVPPTAFKHVEYSLQNCFVKGMKLEVHNKSDPSTFWVATVMMTCGPLLRLRYDGYGDDSSNDFWCDFATTEIHHIGWSAQNGKNLQPPDEIKDKVSDWRSFLLESLTGARTAPSSFLEKNSGITPVDQIKCGMMLELQDVLNPLQVWLVQVLENVGGRLYLRLESTQSACKHFWMFYLNPRLHPIGWASEQAECVYRPPKDIYDEQTDDKWAEILQTTLKQCKDDVVPEDVFKDQTELKNHQFSVGMKMEALNPGTNQIGPATVIKVINNNYFVVEMDDLRPAEKRTSKQICCNSEYLGIFPVSWCQCKGIRLAPPPGWTNNDFVWGEYLSFCNAKAAPEKLFTSGTDDHDFERGMKLEAVNPSNPNQICAATITKIVGPLLWIHLDHVRDIPSHIEDIDSRDIFPVGWCESNNYQLKPPLKSKPKPKPSSECKTEEVYRSITSSRGKGAWCPKIYFNHRCFSGPYLSKGRISDLPKHVGPGPMDLVLKEVLRLLVSIAYVPCRAMKEIQQDVPPNPYMESHILKAKYKGKKYKVMIEVCNNESQLEEFCRNICIKLECCTYLFSPLRVSDNCPENCQQLTKTKSNPSYVKKKKVGTLLSSKPSTAELENGEPKKRGRKRKRFLFVQKKGQQGQRHQEAHTDHQKDEGFIDYDDDEDGNGDRRNYDIQTRGAKLPKYSFERKTHKKILMSQASIHSGKNLTGLKGLKELKVFPSQNLKVDLKEASKHALQPREGSIKLQSNPLYWSVAEVVQYVKTTDCSHLARIMKEQEVDGQAFLLMNLSAIQEHLELKLGPAVKLCHQIERLKLAFFENYA